MKTKTCKVQNTVNILQQISFVEADFRKTGFHQMSSKTKQMHFVDKVTVNKKIKINKRKK